MNCRRAIGRLLLIPILTVLLASPGLAGEKKGTLQRPTSEKLNEPNGYVAGRKPKGSQAPELDSSESVAAAVLLLGGTLVAFGRRRRPSWAEPSSPIPRT